MTNSKYKIDKTFVPISSFHTTDPNKKTELHSLLESLSHGQSFVCDKKSGLVVRSSFNYWNKKTKADKVLVTRSINNGKEMRCWIFDATV
jgi:hypothetical protein